MTESKDKRHVSEIPLPTLRDIADHHLSILQHYHFTANDVKGVMPTSKSKLCKH